MYQRHQENIKQLPKEPSLTNLKRIAAVIVVIIILIASVYFFILREPTEEEKNVTIYDVSKIRELPVLEKVPIRYMTEDELGDYLIESIESEDIEELEETRLIFDALFLLDYDENLTQILLDSYTAQILGFYVPDEKEVFVIEGSSTVMDKVTLSHEFTHALQDQHFNLTAFMEAENGDESLAREAVVEGDATLTMNYYMRNLSNDEIETLMRETAGPDPSDELPYAIKQVMLFPYFQGWSFVWELFNESGWDSVNDVYLDPPTSTEQVMHIQKYIDREEPLTVWYETAIPNMTLAINDTLGEFLIYLMLDHYPSSQNAVAAAEGWGGDRFHYYKNDTDFLSVLKIEWDTQYDASEFYSTYSSWVNGLPYQYRQAWNSNRLQIEISHKVTTIYYSSDSNIIDGIINP